MNDEQQNQPPMGDLPDIEAQQAGPTPGPKPARNRQKKGKGGGLFMTLILLLVVILGGYYLFNTFVQPKEEAPAEDSQLGFSSSLEERDFDALAPAEPVALDEEGPVSNSALLAVNTRIANLESELTKLSGAMTSQLELIAKQAPGSAAEAIPALEKIEAAVASLNNELNLLKDSVAELDEKYVSQAEMDGIVTRVKRLEGRHSKARKARAQAAAVKLPFQLVSVDLWNGRKFAAVSMHDKVSLLADGDALMGWWVDTLDYKSQMAVFKNNKGQTIKKYAQR